MIIFSAIYLLLSNAVSNRRDSSTLYSKTSSIILAYTLLVLYINLDYGFNNGISLFGSLLYFNYYTLIYILLIYNIYISKII